MNVAIGKIKVTERIRKLTAGVDELAQDIQKNGLINPITVMTIDGDDHYQLLAGLRRLRATQSLGREEIAVTVVPPKDAEAALNIEYSENVQREAFTYSEKMDYARLIAEIERVRAKERQNEGRTLGGSVAGNGRPKDGSLVIGRSPSYEDKGKQKQLSRDVVGEKIGMSGAQYDRARYIADNASQEVINELDRGDRTIFGTYKELRATEKKPQAEKPSSKATLNVEKRDSESSGPLPMPVSDLERAIRAESELDAFKYRQHNEIYHRDTIIENLKIRVAELETALEAANARIRELEGETNAGTAL